MVEPPAAAPLPLEAHLLHVGVERAEAVLETEVRQARDDAEFRLVPLRAALGPQATVAGAREADVFGDLAAGRVEVAAEEQALAGPRGEAGADRGERARLDPAV